MTKYKCTYNNHCKGKKRNRFQTDSVVSGVLTRFVVVVVVVVLAKSILEILLAQVGSHVSLEARWSIDRIHKFGYVIILWC